MSTSWSQERLQESLSLVTTLLEKQRVIEALTHKQESKNKELIESLVHRQNLALLQRKLRDLHPADLAHIIEVLPQADRLVVWAELEPHHAAQVLLESSRSVCDSLVAETERGRLIALLGQLDPDDLAYISESIDPAIVAEVVQSLDAREQSLFRSTIAYPDGSVGHLMSPELVWVRDSWDIAGALEEVRRRAELPSHTEALFVVDARNVLRGTLSIKDLLLRPPGARVSAVMSTDVVRFTPRDRASDAARAFERYDLIAAPVVDERGKLVGRLTVDVMMDFLRRQAQSEALRRAGLAGEEDYFAPAWTSAKNRWLWLLVNLLTAFVASRVIGLFESTIRDLVALAALMPIVASIGGNTGNQTVALMIRGLALDRITRANVRHLLQKELFVGLMNGAVWGTVVGLAATALYGSVALGLVMAAAILLNLVVAAMVGCAVPLALQRLGRDPAQGSSVLLTFTTDSMGFFIFLGLARAFLA
ncbi:magnesium transporter [Sorangium sp. So ce1078]|uniref:magnesium transporter n=1 Tax=Sorangium sp. So ce1078 TaxID=3133329 RepID=UPI003F609EA5